MNQYQKIKDLSLDAKTTTVVLFQSATERETKSGKAYCSLELSDGESQITANLWNTSKEELLMKIQERSLITAELYPKMYNDALTYELFRYDKAPDGCEIKDFVIHAPYDAEYMYSSILKKLRAEIPVSDMPDLVDFAIEIYENNKEKIMYWSAAKSIHHNFLGGWLYHNFRMLYTAASISRIYTTLDKELLLTATVLHDIGKLFELETDELGIADYTIEGTLFGHALIGIEMLNDTFRENNIHYGHLKEKFMLLKHLIASHHKNLEWGAITVPATPEALVLHAVDLIDAKTTQYESILAELEPGEMSDRVFGLDGRVYKPAYASK